MTPRFRFKPGMFPDLSSQAQEIAADQANAALDAYLQSCPVVYGLIIDGLWECYEQPRKLDTHEAILFDLRELEKPECDHEPAPIQNMEGFKSIKVETLKCIHCGAKLKATWEAVK